MDYTHVDISAHQSPKVPGSPCGDLVVHDRTLQATTLVAADGIGSGLRASLAARLSTSRFRELIRQGFSLRESFERIVRTLQGWRSPELPFAAFSAARILNDGSATVLSYEMPSALYVDGRRAHVLPRRSFPLGPAVVEESHCYLQPKEALLLVTDGVTQAGIGGRRPGGWTAEGVERFVTERLGAGARLDEIPRMVHDRARELDTPARGDDVTVLMASSRPGIVLNILTGPPSVREKDGPTVRSFLARRGWKVVCGGTTAGLVARETGARISVDTSSLSPCCPPRYRVEGLDLATEGAVVLNQVCNIFAEPPEALDPESAVTELHRLLTIADRVNITVGVAENPATRDISYRQQGILTRRNVVPVLEELLHAAGKLVVVEYV